MPKQFHSMSQNPSLQDILFSSSPSTHGYENESDASLHHTVASGPSQIPALRSISQCEHIARRLHSLDLILAAYHHPSPTSSGSGGTGWIPMLPTLYHSVPNLKVLALPAGNIDFIPPPTSPFRLSKLTCQLYDTLEFESRLNNFLSVQTTIQDLNHLNEIRQKPYRTLPPNCLSGLSTLSATATVVTTLFPGRKIRNLYVVDHSTPKDAPEPEAAKHVHKLSLLGLHSLTHYQACFKTLNYLEIDVVRKSFLLISLS